MNERSKNICLFPECDKLANTRGLCKACYQVAAHLIREGQTSWSKLEAAGRAHPLAPAPRVETAEKKRQWFLDSKVIEREEARKKTQPVVRPELRR